MVVKLLTKLGSDDLKWQKIKLTWTIFVCFVIRKRFSETVNSIVEFGTAIKVK